ncbi:MAG: NAD(P)H-dependent oxidoreductase [Pseudobutyrivibrio sp.]|nr:NAD(P)H-dependent oxidoreductase [Pseudobutyrivibrio sp.]
MESVLFVNACVRKESRTKALAEKLLNKLGESYQEVVLKDINFPVVNEEFLNQRERLVSEGDFDNPIFVYARQFAAANTIVIAAPYWDLSFPAMLKQYLEQVSVVGVTFKYSEEGAPISLCNAKRLFYVTTAGGDFTPEDYGFGYVKALANGYFGIPEVIQIKADGLDIYGADVYSIINEAYNKIDLM